MMNRWLLTLLLAPPLSPAVMPLEAYTLYWYLLGANWPTAAERDWNDLPVEPAPNRRRTAQEAR
jgi:hypothetical protein